MQGTLDGPDQWNIERFICAHAIMMALEGIPAIYIHSLVGTHNDQEKFEKTQQNRAINRHQWNYDALSKQLSDKDSSHFKVYDLITKLLHLRQQQKAFHPNATQFTLHLNEQLFGFWRQSMDRRQSIFCIYNVSDQPQSLHITDLNLIITDRWWDLISGHIFDENTESISLSPYQVLWITNI